MLNAEQILEQGLIKTEFSKGKPAQVGYDLSAKSINAIGKDQLIKPAIGMVLKDKTILNTYTPVPLTKIDRTKKKVPTNSAKYDTPVIRILY
jgi:hypothetical protein